MPFTYEPLYTVKEVSAILKVNVDRVYDLIDDGLLPCIRLGSKKIKGCDLETFINTYPVEQKKI